MEAVWLAVVAAVVGPLLLAHLQGRQRMQEKMEDWRRQDVVAERAAEVAQKLLTKQEETAAKTREAASLLVKNNEVVAKTARVTNEKLDVIHTLVNSNMTAALQAELDATRAQTVLMRELISFKVAQGQEPSKDASAALQLLEEKVQKLAANLADRLQQTKVADAQIFIAEKRQIDEDMPKEE